MHIAICTAFGKHDRTKIYERERTMKYKIVALSDGTVAGNGSSDTFLKKNGIYAAW